MGHFTDNTEVSERFLASILSRPTSTKKILRMVWTLAWKHQKLQA